MPTHDCRGDPITGATPNSLEAFEEAARSFRMWRGDPAPAIAAALSEAPGFVMAHVLHAYTLLCTRDPASVRAAAPVYEAAAALRVNARERRHLAVIAAVLRDDYEAARSNLGDLLAIHPRDLLALQVAHAFDYLGGDVAQLHDRVAAVLPAWSRGVPGYHAVLAMRAFGLVEAGHHAHALDVGLEALALEPFDARAHHAIAHVFEMTGRAPEGQRWLLAHRAGWDGDTTVARHCWWHLALLHLQRGEAAAALALYDTHLAGRPRRLSDLIDASALLWRVFLHADDAGERWLDLADDWAPHLADGFCTFSDLHAMMAFVGARRWGLATQLVRELEQRQSMLTRHGATTRFVGLPASRALLAFKRGDFARAAHLLGALPPIAHRLGGSHAQRDVFHLTLRAATERTRRQAAERRLAA
ncbi:MAG TPA: tetratricopeptide repeat protein [Burkholderiaceae bacterium]|nr:tetratricopeptide repeat protein [Burkholderiaceae bacterium]